MRPYQIMHQRVLIHISVSLPESDHDLKRIKGIGNRALEKNGPEVLEIVGEYRKKQSITSDLLLNSG